MVPAGRSNVSFQPCSGVLLELLISYWPVKPLLQPLVLEYAAPTVAALAEPAKAKAPAATAAAATIAPVACAVRLGRRRWVVDAMGCLPPRGGVRSLGDAAAR